MSRHSREGEGEVVHIKPVEELLELLNERSINDPQALATLAVATATAGLFDEARTANVLKYCEMLTRMDQVKATDVAEFSNLMQAVSWRMGLDDLMDAVQDELGESK